jgi:hypothetical protein
MMRRQATAAWPGRNVVIPAKTSAYLASVALLLGATACGKEDVTHFRVAKEPQAAATPATPASVELPPRPNGRALRWTLPNGWSDGAGGQLRYATLKPPVKGEIDASVVVLPGPAGGELANVNRWRGQIGLPAIDDAALAKARRRLETKAGPLKVYDFTSEAAPRRRLLAGLTEQGGETWFVKMTGDADAVGAARDDFMKLLGSLRFE